MAEFSRPVVNYFIDQGALLIFEKEVNRAAAYFKDKESTEALVLNAEQERAVQAVTSKIGQPSKPFLLEGDRKWKDGSLPPNHPRGAG